MSNSKEKIDILLVDNFEQNRRIIKSILKKAGYKVSDVSDAKEAVKRINTKKPDIIISEVKLPKISGLVFYQKVKQQSSLKAIPFIFISNCDKKTIIPLIQKSNDTFISKDSSWKEVLSQIENFINKRLAKQVKKSTKSDIKVEKTAKSDIKIQKSKRQNKKVSFPQELEIKKESNDDVKRKKRIIPQMILPPDHSTRNYGLPVAPFNAKSIKNLTQTLFKSFKKGENPKCEVLEIHPFEMPLLNLGLKEKIKENNAMFVKMREEAILEDLDVIENENIDSTIEEILASHDSHVEEIIEQEMHYGDEDEETHKLKDVELSISGAIDLEGIMLQPHLNKKIIFKQLFPEFSLSEKMGYIYINKQQDIFESSFEDTEEKKKFYEFAYMIIAMSGLCMQMFSLSPDVERVKMKTEDKEIFLISNKKQETYLIGIITKIK